jgi:hypothetical protein
MPPAQKPHPRHSRALGAHVDGTTLFDDDNFDASIEPPGFPKEMNGKERTGRSTADDGDAIVVLEAPALRSCAAHGPSPFGSRTSDQSRRPAEGSLRDKHSILVEGC